MTTLDSYCVGSSSGHDNFARVQNEFGSGVVFPAMDQFNRLLEKCDSCQGVEFYHGLGGGTGSAVPSLMLPLLRDTHPKLPLIGMTVLPGARDAGTVAPYNAVLGMAALIEHTDATVWFNNDSMLRVSQRPELALPGASLPGYGAVNELAARTMTNITCDVRLPSDSNGSWARFAATMVCFPRIHFFMPSISPSAHMEPRLDAAAEFTAGSACFLDEWQLTPIRYAYQIIYTGQLMYRGAVPSLRATEAQLKLQSRRNFAFADWLPNNLHVRQQARAAPPENRSRAHCSRPLHVRGCVTEHFRGFTAMFMRRAFVHWFLGAGLDEMEFVEAESNLKDLFARRHVTATAARVDTKFTADVFIWVFVSRHVLGLFIALRCQ